MSRTRRIGLTSDDENFVADLIRKHGHRHSRCGVVLAEILTSSDLSCQRRAAIVFGLEGYRRGLGRLERLITELVQSIESSDSIDSASPELSLLHQLLFAVGRMDTLPSHALVERLIHGSKEPTIRADALECTAFEEERFDWDLVLPFASFDADVPEILSALYALEFHNYATRFPDQAREKIPPLLHHPYPMVRIFAIRVLMFNDANLEIVRPFAEDPDPNVKSSAEEAIEWMEQSGRGSDVSSNS